MDLAPKSVSSATDDKWSKIFRTTVSGLRISLTLSFWVLDGVDVTAVASIKRRLRFGRALAAGVASAAWP